MTRTVLAPPFIPDHKAHHSVLLCERRVLHLPFCIRGRLPLHGSPDSTHSTPRLHSTRALARAPPGRPIGALRPSDTCPNRERPYMATCDATGSRAGTQPEISWSPDARTVFSLRILRHACESETRGDTTRVRQPEMRERRSQKTFAQNAICMEAAGDSPEAGGWGEHTHRDHDASGVDAHGTGFAADFTSAALCLCADPRVVKCKSYATVLYITGVP